MKSRNISVGTLERQPFAGHRADGVGGGETKTTATAVDRQRAQKDHQEAWYAQRQLYQQERARQATINLVVFSGLILVLPIVTYFASLHAWFGIGSEVWAACAAVLAANVVLVGYLIVALRGDDAGDANDGAPRREVVAGDDGNLKTE